MRPEPIDLHNISKIYEPETDEKEEKVELKESTRPMKRGEVYYAKCFHYDAELGETNRPAVVVSNDGINEKGNFVNVIYLTTAPKTSHPCHVSVECKKQHATAVCERIQSIGKCHLGDYIETLTDDEMFQIDHGIEIANSLKDNVYAYENQKDELVKETVECIRELDTLVRHLCDLKDLNLRARNMDISRLLGNDISELRQILPNNNLEAIRVSVVKQMEKEEKKIRERLQTILGK